MKLDVLTLEQCQIVRIWRNEQPETLRTPYLLTADQQAEFFKGVINNRNSPHRYFAILQADKFVAMGALTNICFESRIAEISLIVSPEYRRKGIGKKAVLLLLKEGFNRLNLKTVFGETYFCNEIGLAFWQKIVKKYSGYWTTLPNRKFHNGQYYDSVYFSFDSEKFIPSPTTQSKPTPGQSPPTMP